MRTQLVVACGVMWPVGLCGLWGYVLSLTACQVLHVEKRVGTQGEFRDEARGRGVRIKADARRQAVGSRCCKAQGPVMGSGALYL